MSGWTRTQLTFGSPEGRYHAHSYYDIPVIDHSGASIVGFQTTFSGRQPRPEDAVEVGLVETARPGSWRTLGRTSAWSWQQGPMAQFVPGCDAIVWNDREDSGFVARIVRSDGTAVRTLSRPIYAVAPDGRSGLSIDMARLNLLRPGYGYATGPLPVPDRAPADDGVWSVPLDGSVPRLVLALDRAVAFLLGRSTLPIRLRHRWARYHYWFNHVKIAPDGKRFTVKLRWRKPGGGWNGTMGVSLTCGTDGSDLRLLAHATSHVLWLDADRLYFYDERRRDVPLQRDTAPTGTRIGAIGRGAIEGNVHLRHLPPLPPATEALPRKYVFDTPYRETVDVMTMSGDDAPVRIATFTGHVPAKGPFRCDLHPCPDRSGRRIVVSSPQDGGRQIYLLEERS